jgi:hypothetical protein
MLYFLINIWSCLYNRVGIIIQQNIYPLGIVRIRVKIDPQNPVVCCNRRLNGDPWGRICPQHPLLCLKGGRPWNETGTTMPSYYNRCSTTKKYSECRVLAYILQPFTYNGDVSIWVNDPWVERKITDNQSISSFGTHDEIITLTPVHSLTWIQPLPSVKIPLGRVSGHHFTMLASRRVFNWIILNHSRVHATNLLACNDDMRNHSLFLQ